MSAGGQFDYAPRSESPVSLDARTHLDLPLTRAAHRVIDSITDAGGRPLLVGGCVRDAILRPGDKPKDIDIEVYGLDSDALAAALDDVGRVDEVGKSFSVLTVRVAGESFDVATPRTERRTGPGHRDFEIVPDPFTDTVTASARRDFTINALMWDPATSQVIDHWGGLDDLRNGTLRHTTDTFAEDPLRVLRGARFAARYGFTMHPETVELSRVLADDFDSLSTERVWGEWSTMAATAAQPSRWLSTLEETGWLNHFPELAVLRTVDQDPTWHPEGDVLEHCAQAADVGAELADKAGLHGTDRAVIVLASMLHDVGKATHTQVHADGRITSHGHDESGQDIAQAFLQRIGAPQTIRRVVAPIVRRHMASTSTSTPSLSAVRRLARNLAPATIEQWALVVGADRGGRGHASGPGNAGAWLSLASDAGALTAPVKPTLGGGLLVKAGWTPGPAFKEVIAAAVAAQDDGAFDDEAGAAAWLAARYPDGPPVA